MKKSFILILCGWLVALSAGAQKSFNKYENSYNYRRALELLQADDTDYEQVKTYLQKELEEHPRNGYAYFYLGSALAVQNEYGQLLTAMNNALDNVPKKDKETRVSIYRVRAKTYVELEDTLQAIADYTAALALDPKNEDVLGERGELYCRTRRYAEADADFRRLTTLAPGRSIGFKYLGMNLMEQRHYEAALKQFDYAERLAPTDAQAKSFRAECRLRMGQKDGAITDLLAALQGDEHDWKAWGIINEVADSCLELFEMRLKGQEVKEPSNPLWVAIRAQYYDGQNRPHDALEAYRKFNDLTTSTMALKGMAKACLQLERTDEAVAYLKEAVELDSADSEVLSQLILAELNAERLDDALAHAETLVRQAPDEGYALLTRAMVYNERKEYEKALQDCNAAILLTTDNPYFYTRRARIYLEKGDEAAAQADFRRVVALDTLEENSETPYAYAFLGEAARARALGRKIFLKDATDGDLYNLACIYALTSESDSAFSYLHRAVAAGYIHARHMRKDSDLNLLHDTEEFERILRLCEEGMLRQRAAGAAGPVEKKTAEIPFVKENGITKVKCAVNGLPLHFYFDTGASDVTLSDVEASFMMKNGYLSKKDIVGRAGYGNANGEISVGTVIVLREIAVGELTLQNVRASIVAGNKAPLLLGQSVLSRLGTIEIDNARRMLKITYNVRK